VGAPSWFSVLWKMIRPLVNSRTQAKIKICSKKGTFCFIGRKDRKRRREGIVTSVPPKRTQEMSGHYPFFTRLALSFFPLYISPLTTTETFETIKEFVAPDFIPVEYGGLLKYSDQPDSCRRQSPEEVRMREFVLAVNKRHGVEMVKG